jgi:hypothetical protein
MGMASTITKNVGSVFVNAFAVARISYGDWLYGERKKIRAVA